MELGEYQRLAHGTSLGVEIENNMWLYPALGLSGEAGELMNKLKKLFRDGDNGVPLDDNEEIMMELGDILWYLSEFATRAHWNLDDIAINNLNKLRKRNERGTIHGSGDNR